MIISLWTLKIEIVYKDSYKYYLPSVAVLQNQNSNVLQFLGDSGISGMSPSGLFIHLRCMPMSVSLW